MDKAWEGHFLHFFFGIMIILVSHYFFRHDLLGILGLIFGILYSALALFNVFYTIFHRTKKEYKENE